MASVPRELRHRGNVMTSQSKRLTSRTVARQGVALVVCGLLLTAASTHACPWDYETLRAETASLPCVAPVAMGVFAQHTPEYLKKRIEAADAALAWAPGWLEALDSKAMALLRLKRYPEARAVLEVRQRIAPDAYATHANLGTLLTFSGDFEAALAHIDKALALEPKAHFGRERYHRQLVEYLIKRKQGADTAGADFLGLKLTDAQRLKGSPEVAKAAGVTDETFDALVSMIAVYGASDVPALYEALGNSAALRGQQRVAFAAYQRAVELKHPARAELKKWCEALDASIKAGYQPDKHWGDIYAGMERSLANRDQPDAQFQANAYTRWETAMLKAGLPFWRPSGLDVLYWKQEQLGLRCPVAIPFQPELELAAPASDAYAKALGLVALAARGEPANCDTVKARVLEAATRSASELRLPDDAYFRAGAPFLREPLGMLIAASLSCPGAFKSVKATLDELRKSPTR